MALVVTVEATVTYACKLSKEEEKKIREYSENNCLDINTAVLVLYNEGEIDLYKHSTESDFSTNDVTEVYEYNEEEE